MNRRLTMFIVFVAASLAGRGAMASDDSQRLAALARCVDDSAIAVVHFDLSRWKISPLSKQFGAALAGLFGVRPDAFDSFTAAIQATREAGGRDVFVVFAPAPMNARNPYFVLIPESGRNATAVSRAIKERIDRAVVGNAIVAGNSGIIDELRAHEPVARPELAAAFAAARSAPISLLIVPSADQRRALEESLSALPRQIGGGATTVLSRGIRWAAIGLDLANESGELIVQSADAAAAERLRDFLRELPGKTSGIPSIKVLFPDGRLPDALVPAVKNDRLTLSLKRSDPALATLENAFAEAGKSIQSSVLHTQRRDQIKQIALAMHNYLDRHKTFPPAAIYDKEGKPLLSWRVSILPFLECDKLYKEFRLDEPWDSEHNKKLISRIPPIYQSPELKIADYGKTTLLGIAGKHSFFHDREGTRIRDITDGTSNTIMIVDVPPTAAALWTKPADFDADAPQLVSRLIGGRTGAWTGMCDGSARFFPGAFTSKGPEEKLLRSLMTIDGGEIISTE